jgi:hypothetical protein
MGDKKEAKVFERKCRFCGKLISSLNERQAEFNHHSHESACEQKHIKRAVSG